MTIVVADKPFFNSVPMRCNACSSDYNGWMITNCSLAMAAAYMRAMSCPCPGCGADSSHQAIRTDANA